MKYIIELEDSPMRDSNGNKLWKATGFNSLVFDENGLCKLQPYDEAINTMVDAHKQEINAVAKKNAENAINTLYPNVKKEVKYYVDGKEVDKDAYEYALMKNPSYGYLYNMLSDTFW